jgi:hypothetical protein
MPNPLSWKVSTSLKEVSTQNTLCSGGRWAVSGQSFLMVPDDRCCVVPLTTLGAEPFDVIREIPVVVSPEDDGYLATFLDANIGIAGDNKEEAVANLQMLLVDMFDDLEARETRLGPHPKQQLAILRTHMRRRQ